MPAKCYYPSVFNQINSTCEYQNTCSIRGTSNTFSVADPCPTFSKQLFIQYQCVDYYGLNSTINQCRKNKQVPPICPAINDTQLVRDATACDAENAPLTLSCKVGEKIEIVCAYYGLHPDIKKCILPTNVPVCYFASSYNNVTSICTGQQSCSIQFLNTFADPCQGMDKALYVRWKCNR